MWWKPLQAVRVTLRFAALVFVENWFMFANIVFDSRAFYKVWWKPLQVVRAMLRFALLINRSGIGIINT